ncbi:MAG: tRNA pseudouridine(13) synthase TruD [Gammaproteobacteria bacterium]|nr:MAG: tRNA pseudouridine(13) synthase TruD [Gammaproteobacteria bacterium]
MAPLPRAFGGAVLDGRLKARPEDFRVEEILGHRPAGEGEHLLLRVTKRGENTLDVARRLARFAGIHPSGVGFAGLKDRHAETVQTFSVHLPSHPVLDWHALEDESLNIEVLGWHRRKLRRGGLQGNRFHLRIGEPSGDRARAGEVLQAIAEGGFPNYFGTQRFGRGASNLIRAQALLLGRLRRPKPEQLRMLVSAARAYLFNRVLAERVRAGSWNRALAGEVLEIEGEGRQLLARALDEALALRVVAGELHPTGPLAGRPGHGLAPQGEAAALEASVLGVPPFDHWVGALAGREVPADRRPLRVVPRHLAWDWRREALELSFELPAGSYATSLVRELLA